MFDLTTPNLWVHIYFTSSFKVNLNEKYKVNEDYLTIIQKKNRRILCKNFIMFLLICKRSNFFNDMVYFVFPKRSKSGHNSILRPPYKNKTSRHPMGFERWNLKISFKIKRGEVFEYNDFEQFNNQIKKIYKLVYFFDSNIANQRRIKFELKCNNTSNFLLKNFN